MIKKKDNEFFLDAVSDVMPLKEKLKTNNNTEKEFVKLKRNRYNQTKKNENNNKQEGKKTNMFSGDVLRKLKKGKIKIDMKIDFHGLSLEAAYIKFISTINECYSNQKRCILFITGKGIKKGKDDEGGGKLYNSIIRESIQRWVFDPTTKNKVLYFVPADRTHGADGAFFIYLRKN